MRRFKGKVKVIGYLFILLGVIGGIFYYDYDIRSQSEAETDSEQVKESPLWELYRNYGEKKPAQEILKDLSRPTIPITDKVTQPAPVEEEEIPQYKLEQTGWVPVWDYAAGINSLDSVGESFASVSPVFYSVHHDGTLIDRRPANWESIKSVTTKHNLKLIPSISLFDADQFQKAVSGSNYNTHLQSIISAVMDNGFDGIDIDYEMIYRTDGSKYIQLIKDLKEAFKGSGKTLSVTVMAKWGDIPYSSLPETREVQDYKKIGELVDELRIMTYDYTPSTSATPGPIGPSDWIDKVLQYATTKTDPSKIWLGIHLYGYEWDNFGRVRAITFSDIPDIEKLPGYNFQFNHSYKEGVSTYQCKETATCTLFFQTGEGIDYRKGLARKHGIKGVAYWRLGGEGDLLQD